MENNPCTPAYTDSYLNKDLKNSLGMNVVALDLSVKKINFCVMF